MPSDSSPRSPGHPMPAKRPYLRSEARRQQLLDVALALVDRVGLGHFTISQLAQEAGVTRQTAYHHFTDINDLFQEILRARFTSMQDNLNKVFEEHREDVVTVVRRACEIGVDLPLRDRQMLRYVFGGLESDRPELKDALRQLRSMLTTRWCRLFYGTPDVTQKDRAAIWAAINSLFGLYDLLESGEVTRDEAIEVIMALTTNLPRQTAN